MVVWSHCVMHVGFVSHICICIQCPKKNEEREGESWLFLLNDWLPKELREIHTNVDKMCACIVENLVLVDC